MKKIRVFLLGIIYSAIPFAFSQGAKPIPEKPVLLVVDIQNDYLPIMDADEMNRVMKAIPSAIKLFHEKGFPVIRIYHTDPKRGPRPGEQGFEFPNYVPLGALDVKVVKTRPSAFVKTDLEAIIKKNNSNTIYICGLSMTGCVYATYQDAVRLAMNPFIIDGFVTSHDAAKTSEYQAKCRSVDFVEMSKRLSDAKN